MYVVNSIAPSSVESSKVQLRFVTTLGDFGVGGLGAVLGGDDLHVNAHSFNKFIHL